MLSCWRFAKHSLNKELHADFGSRTKVSLAMSSIYYWFYLALDEGLRVG